MSLIKSALQCFVIHVSVDVLTNQVQAWDSNEVRSYWTIKTQLVHFHKTWSQIAANVAIAICVANLLASIKNSSATFSFRWFQEKIHQATQKAVTSQDGATRLLGSAAVIKAAGERREDFRSDCGGRQGHLIGGAKRGRGTLGSPLPPPRHAG